MKELNELPSNIQVEKIDEFEGLKAVSVASQAGTDGLYEAATVQLDCRIQMCTALTGHRIAPSI